MFNSYLQFEYSSLHVAIISFICFSCTNKFIVPIFSVKFTNSFKRLNEQGKTEWRLR
jgi:hypothetical protein